MATSQASTVLRRALLYVPASHPKFLTKSLSLKSDNITYDLEDAVTPEAKPSARQALHDHLITSFRNNNNHQRPESIGEIAVRINAVSTPYAIDDLKTLAKIPSLDAIVIPKVNSASDLTFVSNIIRQTCPERFSTTTTTTTSTTSSSKPPIKLIALIESARAIMDLPSICSAGVSQSTNLDGLIFAAEDFALDLSITRTPSLNEFLYARSAIVTAARAFNIPSTIDLVCTSYKGEEGTKQLREECQNGKQMGFNGKQCIHPSQVDTVQEMFGPSKEEVEWAIRVVIADEKAAAAGRGAWTFQNKMIDAPVAGKARAIVAKAEKCGFPISSLREEWQHEEPQ